MDTVLMLKRMGSMRYESFGSRFEQEIALLIGDKTSSPR